MKKLQKRKANSKGGIKKSVSSIDHFGRQKQDDVKTTDSEKKVLIIGETENKILFPSNNAKDNEFSPNV